MTSWTSPDELGPPPKSHELRDNLVLLLTPCLCSPPGRRRQVQQHRAVRQQRRPTSAPEGALRGRTSAGPHPQAGTWLSRGLSRCQHAPWGCAAAARRAVPPRRAAARPSHRAAAPPRPRAPRPRAPPPGAGAGSSPDTRGIGRAAAETPQSEVRPGRAAVPGTEDSATAPTARLAPTRLGRLRPGRRTAPRHPSPQPPPPRTRSPQLVTSACSSPTTMLVRDSKSSVI